MGLNQGWIFFKMGATVRGSMESKAYARENKNDGPWNLRRKEGTMRDSKNMAEQMDHRFCWSQRSVLMRSEGISWKKGMVDLWRSCRYL